ncbi:transposase family protein [Saccharopolyspora pogona]|uniref:transposase family protein n=1 Tax=Saccharopolyspora pogona TaxID=333966 RepID=UPI0016858A6A|nr:transposase family protein [Saccharopolyspora pogona]
MKNQSSPAEGTEPIVHQAQLPVSRATIDYLASLITTHCRKIRSRWRKVTPGTQAIIVLAVLRHDQRLLDIAGGNRVSASTIRRWVLEVIDLLAARAPRLDRVLSKVARGGGEVVLLDGTLVRTQRRTGKNNRRNYSGKHKAHGLLFLALTDHKGNLLWFSAAKPGRASEVTTARHNNITTALRDAELGAMCDLGFTGLEDDPDEPVIIIGRRAARAHPLTDAQKQANQLVARERATCEHGFADLKNWRILTRLRMHAANATRLLRALLVLTNLEITR